MRFRASIVAMILVAGAAIAAKNPPCCEIFLWSGDAPHLKSLEETAAGREAYRIEWRNHMGNIHRANTVVLDEGGATVIASVVVNDRSACLITTIDDPRALTIRQIVNGSRFWEGHMVPHAGEGSNRFAWQWVGVEGCRAGQCSSYELLEAMDLAAYGALGDELEAILEAVPLKFKRNRLIDGVPACKAPRSKGR